MAGPIGGQLGEVLLLFKALFDCSESEISLLNPTILLQPSPAVNANPMVRTDLESGTGLAQTGSRDHV